MESLERAYVKNRYHMETSTMDNIHFFSGYRMPPTFSSDMFASPYPKFISVFSCEMKHPYSGCPRFMTSRKFFASLSSVVMNR